MICSRCKRDFPEREIQESHDVPCYLFIEVSSRRERKQLADKYCRRWLCVECHKKYESSLNKSLKSLAKLFSRDYFGGEK